jgi:hypothetical protein
VRRCLLLGRLRVFRDAECEQVAEGAVSAEPHRVQAVVAAKEIDQVEVLEDEPGIEHDCTKSNG